jgi:hypothetical protein
VDSPAQRRFHERNRMINAIQLARRVTSIFLWEVLVEYKLKSPTQKRLGLAFAIQTLNGYILK